MAFEIGQRSVEGITILALEGRLVAGAAVSDLRTLFDTFVSEDIHNVVLDLARVQYIDSSGLGILVAGHTLMHNAGGALKLLNLSGRSAQLLVLTRISTLFEIFDDERAAINSFFPDREVRRFDILEFVKSQEQQDNNPGGNES